MTKTGVFQRFIERFSGPKTVDLPVSCYGKLPIYKDFLREKLAGKEAQAFKQWLDQGISRYWKESAAYCGETIFPHAFLFRFSGTSKYVVGYLWGSHDQGNLRSFPFSVFVSLPAGRGASSRHAILEALEPIIKAGRQWNQEAAGLNSFEDFIRWSRSLSLKITFHPERQVRSRILARADELTIGEFSSSLWAENADVEWPALLSYLNRHHDAIRGSSRAAVNMAARFPSSDRLPKVLQAQFWTLLIEHFDHRRDRPFQIFIPLYEEQAGITILLRSLRSDDVFALHPQMPSYEHIEDFRSSVPRSSSQGIDPLTADEKQQPLRSLLDADYATGERASNRGE